MMKNLKTSAILALSVILVFAMGTMAFAASLPSATVEEVTGAGLTVTLNGGSLDGQTFTMNKAVTFSTNYTDDALKASDLANFGNWIVDFKITSSTPAGSVSGDKVILVGNYGSYGNVGFALSDLAPTIPDGDYDVMLETGLDPYLKYSDVVNSVGEFKCGIVDNGLPSGSTVSVQLVMYEDASRTVVHNIGDPVVYSKVVTGAPSATVTELTGADLDVTLGGDVAGSYTMDKAVRFSTNYTDDALKASDLANYGDWICDFKMTLSAPAGSIDGNQAILVGNYGSYGDVGFKLSEIAATVPDGDYDVMETTGLDPFLKYSDVVNTVGQFSCGIIDNGLPVGTKVTVQLVMYEDAARTIAHNIGDAVVYEKFNIKMAGKDAYIGDNGLGYLRFITKVGTTGVTAFGTWIVPENFLTDGYENAAKLGKDEAIAKGYEFTADILGIPASYLTKTFYAKSFITTDVNTEWTPVTTAVVSEDKNYTSN